MNAGWMLTSWEALITKSQAMTQPHPNPDLDGLLHTQAVP